MRASIGDVELSWGANRWVLVDGPFGSMQRQVSTPSQLAALLVEMGIAGSQAEQAAAEFWATRPADAGLRRARPGESVRGATALPAWAIVLILLAAVALWVAIRLWGY